VRWGLEREAEGLALAIAEFTDIRSLASQVTSEDRGIVSAPLRAPLERVVAFGQAKRIDIAAIDGTHVRPILGAGERHGELPAIGEQALGRLLQGEVVVHHLPATDRLVAHAPVRDAAGTPGVVSVETSLAPVAAHRTAVLRRTATILLALLVVGGLVSLLISTVITGEIGRLTRTARAFAAGDYDAALAPGAIEEVAVVSATFGIMGSVLKDATLRSTREMRQFDRFNTEATLAEFHADRFSAPVVAEHAGVRLAIDRLGPPLHGDFWFADGDERRGHACLGRLDGTASFDVVLAASAANALLRERCARSENAADVLRETLDLFPVHCCLLLEWHADTRGAVTVHRLGQDGTVARETLRLDPTRTAALTTLEAGADRQAVRYADAHAFDTPRSLVDELRQLSGASAHGGVLALQVTSS
jgi:HAMP domain-containing protein